MSDNKINNGGPAFPQNGEYDISGTYLSGFRPGMTLRDWFAGMALASAVHLGSKTLTLEQLAYTMYAMADAMIAEREKEDQQ